MNVHYPKPSISHGFAFFTAIIVLLLIAVCMTYETYLEHSKRVAERMETEATRIDRALILEIEHSSHLIQGIGQEMMHMDTNDLNSIAFLLRSFDTTATVHHVFSWIDANNNNVVSSNKGVHAPINVADRDFLQKAIANPWKVQIGNPIQGRVSAKWALPVALGMTDATGKYIGTILISMDIYTLTRDLQHAVKESGISFAIYSKSLLPLTQNVSEDKLAQFDSYSDKLKTVNFAAHASGVISTASLFDKNSMYVYYEMSATYPYIIVMGLDNSASASALRTLLIPRLIEIMLIGVFMIMLLWLVRSRIIKPIAELADITGAVVRGEPYHEPAAGGGIDELYVLAQQIKKLGDYLRETRRIGEENKNKNYMLRNAKEAADLSNRIKIEFLASMSHELRIPLNTIIGFSEIMKNQSYGVFENKQYLQYTQDIHEAAKSLQSLTDDMHKLSTAETGMAELQEKHIDIRFILSKALRLVARPLAENKLHVELKLPEVMPRLLMDEQRLEQIIVNIIINLVRDSTSASHIIIRAYAENDHKGMETFCIAFTDTKSEASDAKANSVHEKKPVKYDVHPIGIPLTQALLAMHQVRMEIKNTGKQAITVLHFPKDKLVY